ncbi:hypothetical protein TcG_00084 [Trypanosoma cruzi]|nr:hypothetical protein TcG_00084 [Trypanosoma cruzi]
MTSGPAQVGHRHQCTGVAARHGFPLSAALVVMPWATSPTRLAVDTFGRNELAHRATVLWAQLAPGKDGTRSYFFNATLFLSLRIALGLRKILAAYERGPVPSTASKKGLSQDGRVVAFGAEGGKPSGQRRIVSAAWQKVKKAREERKTIVVPPDRI